MSVKDDPAGCKTMKCTDLINGACHYQADYCKYRPPEPEEELHRLRASNERLEKERDMWRDVAFKNMEELDTKKQVLREAISILGTVYEETKNGYRVREITRQQIKGMLNDKIADNTQDESD